MSRVEVDVFNSSSRGKLALFAARRAGLSSLTPVQQTSLLKLLKEHINFTTRENGMQNEFQYKLMMSASDPAIFLNILAGWHDSANEARKSVLGVCLRDFQMLYPEEYDRVNQQAPIRTP